MPEDVTINQTAPIARKRVAMSQPRARGTGVLSVRADGDGVTRIADLRQSGSTKLVFPRVFRPEAEAIFISCTNLRAASVIERLEKETGKPVVTSNQATFWACLRKLGIDESIPTAGKLLRERVPA